MARLHSESAMPLVVMLSKARSSIELFNMNDGSEVMCQAVFTFSYRCTWINDRFLGVQKPARYRLCLTAMLCDESWCDQRCV